MLLRYFTWERVHKLYKEYVREMFQREGRKPLWRQVSELAWLARTTGYWPHNYFKFNGYIKGKDVGELVDYVPGILFDTIKDEFINPPQFVSSLENKYLTYQILTENHVPTTEVLGRYARHAGFRDTDDNSIDFGEFISSLRSDFVIKPTQAARGVGVDVVHINPQAQLPLAVRGRNLTIGEFVRSFDTSLGEESCPEYLIEKKIEQHSRLSALHPSSLNTIRVDSLRSVDGTIRIFGPGRPSGKNWGGADRIGRGRSNTVGSSRH